MKRIISLDIYRGWGIIVVVILHGVVFNLYGNTSSAGDDVNLWLILPLLPLIILGTWASLFPFISGIGTTYSLNSQLRENPRYLVNKKLHKSIIRGFFLLFFHFVWCLFFCTPEESINGETTQGTISLWMRTGKLRVPPLSTFY